MLRVAVAAIIVILCNRRVEPYCHTGFSVQGLSLGWDGSPDQPMLHCAQTLEVHKHWRCTNTGGAQTLEVDKHWRCTGTGDAPAAACELPVAGHAAARWWPAGGCSGAAPQPAAAAPPQPALTPHSCTAGVCVPLLCHLTCLQHSDSEHSVSSRCGLRIQFHLLCCGLGLLL